MTGIIDRANTRQPKRSSSSTLGYDQNTVATTMASLARPLFAGGVFGAALTASRVHLPTVIIEQMRLTDFHMLEVFLTASACSA